MRITISLLGAPILGVALGIGLAGCYVLEPPEHRLFKAVYEDREGDVAEILENGAVHDVDVTLGRSTALFFAAKNGNSKIVHMLLAAGANPNSVNEDGFTALSIAALYGRSAAVKELIKGGANVDFQHPEFGFTPVIRALRKNNVNMAKELIEAGADACIKNNNGHNALMAAEIYGHSDFVAWYASHGFPACPDAL